METKENKCHHCGLLCSNTNNLTRHISNIHLKEKNHKCDYCDFKTNQKPNLKKHSCYIVAATPPPAEGVETSLYSIEYRIQNRLEQELKAKKITCPFGRIDLITEDTIIEIKKWSEHKKGLGQLLGYASYFPSYKKRLHFFGEKPTKKQMDSIIDVCTYYNIEITMEE